MILALTTTVIDLRLVYIHKYIDFASLFFLLLFSIIFKSADYRWHFVVVRSPIDDASN